MQAQAINQMHIPNFPMLINKGSFISKSTQYSSNRILHNNLTSNDENNCSLDFVEGNEGNEESLLNHLNNEGVTIGGGLYNTFINDMRCRLPTNESIESCNSGQYNKFGPILGSMNLKSQFNSNENRQFFIGDE